MLSGPVVALPKHSSRTVDGVKKPSLISCFTIIFSDMSNCLRFGKIFILVNVASEFLRKRTLRFACRNFWESEFGKST